MRAHGQEPEPVLLVEDPDGPYYGWLYGSDRPGRGPVMVQPHPGLFEMQFPYGSAAEVERGAGRVVRLRLEPREG